MFLVKVVIQNGSIIITEPQTVAERVMVENIHPIVTCGWGKTVEFKVIRPGENTESVCLELVIPAEFEDDLTGTGGIVKKEDRCQHCGGPNH